MVEAGCVCDGDGFAVDPLAAFTLAAFEALEFEAPGWFDPDAEFASPDLLAEFVSPALFDPADEFVLAVTDLLFALPGELELSRAEEFLLLF